MAKLPGLEDLGFTSVQPSASVASYDPTQLARAQESIGAGMKQSAQDYAQIRQSEIETQVNDAYVNQYAPQAAQAWQKFHSLQGKDAVAPDENGVTPMQKYIQTLQQMRTDLRDKMPGTYGKQLFDMRAGRHVEGELDSAAQYTDAQQKAYNITTSKALQDTYADQATSKFLPQDEPGMRLAMQSGLAEIENFGQKTGQSPDTIKQLQSNYTSKVLAGVLYQQANTDPIGALQRFHGQNGHPGLSDEIDDAQLKPQVLAHLTERGQNAEQSSFVQNQINGIPVEAGGKTFQPAPAGASIQERGQVALDNAKQYALLTHPNDPVFMDRLVSRVKSETQQALWQDNLSEAVTMKDMMSGITNADGTRKTFGDAMNDPAWAAQYNALNPKLQGQVRNSFVGTENILTPQSARLVNAVKGMAVTDPEAFMNYDVGSLVGKVPQSEVEQIINMKVSLGNRDQREAQKAEHVRQMLTDPSVISTLSSTGIKPAQLKPGSDTYNAFVGAFVPSVEKFEQQNKRPPNSGELAQITARLSTQVVTDKGYIYDTKKRVFQIGPQDVAYPKTNAEIEALPSGARFYDSTNNVVRVKK